MTATPENVMPAFGDDDTIVKYIDSLYAYLEGRSEGDLPATDFDWKGPKTE